jgi:HSP20 family protein
MKDWFPVLHRHGLRHRRPESFPEMMEDFWRDPFRSFFVDREEMFPVVDVSESDKEIKVSAELPGMDPKDVSISLDGNRLTLRGEKKFEQEEKKEDYHRIERSYGSFCRVINLPGDVHEDQVKASFKNGVLTVVMPKTEKPVGRTIEIES